MKVNNRRNSVRPTARTAILAIGGGIAIGLVLGASGFSPPDPFEEASFVDVTSEAAACLEEAGFEIGERLRFAIDPSDGELVFRPTVADEAGSFSVLSALRSSTGADAADEAKSDALLACVDRIAPATANADDERDDLRPLGLDRSMAIRDCLSHRSVEERFVTMDLLQDEAGNVIVEGTHDAMSEDEAQSMLADVQACLAQERQ
jgi:hypothetical protein